MLKLTSIADYLSRHRVWFLAMTLLISSFVVVKIFLSVATVHANASAYFAGPDEVATGSTFDITFTASVTRGVYSDCDAFGFFEVSGAGVVESVRSGNYPGVQASEWLFPGSYKLQTPSCREGQQGYPSGTYTLATLRIRATGAGAITLNSSGFLMVNGSSLAITPKTIAVRTDVCPNIAGVQATIPSGMIKDASGNCVTPPPPPPPDVCPNIAGVQATIPSGMIKTSSGHCVYPPSTPTNPTPPSSPIDVCPNIPGIQISIPPGMIKDSRENCVKPASGSTPAKPRPTSPPSGGSSGGSAGSGSSRSGGSSPTKSNKVKIGEPVKVDTKEKDELGVITDVAAASYVRSISLTWLASESLSDISIKYVVDGRESVADESVVKLDKLKYEAILSDLRPLSVYSFEISGSLPSKKRVTYSGYMVTRGYPVRIQFNNGNDALKEARVYVGDGEYFTDLSGTLSLELKPGSVDVVVPNDSGSDYKTKITVGELPTPHGQPVEAQDFNIDITDSLKSSAGSAMNYIAYGALALASVTALVVILWRRKRKSVASVKAEDDWMPLTGIYSPTVDPLNPSHTSGQPPAPYYTPLKYDPYQNILKPGDEVVEDMYEVARREGRYKNL